MLSTDLRIELMRSRGQTGGIDTAALTAAFAEMEAEERQRLAWYDGEIALSRSADMRYGEQVFEIAVPLNGMACESPTLAADLEEALRRAHDALYTYALRDQDVVLVNARVSAIDRLPPAPASVAAGGGRRPRRRGCGGSSWAAGPMCRCSTSRYWRRTRRSPGRRSLSPTRRPCCCGRATPPASTRGGGLDVAVG